MSDAATITIDMEHGPRVVPAEPRIEATAAPAQTGWTAVDVERLWLATQRRPWTTLALIPIGAGVPTPRLAAAIAEMGQRHLGGTIGVRDATSVSVDSLQAELDTMAQRARCAARAIVALPPLLQSPAGLALARAADVAVFCIALGSSAIDEAEQILEELGRDRILGSVILQNQKEKR